MNRFVVCSLACSMLAACGSGREPETAASAGTEGAPASGTAKAAPSTPPETPPRDFAEQAARGKALYGEHCARCHGDSGEGKKAPAVVGLKTGALPLEPAASAKVRKTEFKTVVDVADFVATNMPADAPATLTADQYYAILAFDLKANGIDLGDKVLTPSLAATLTIPR